LAGVLDELVEADCALLPVEDVVSVVEAAAAVA
jgi:hypothetical protein